MSSGARWAIAVICVFFGIGFGCAAAMCSGINHRWILWLFAVFCFVISASCFPGKHSAVTNRIIGALIFLVYVAYLIQEIKDKKWIAASQATPCVLNALLGTIVWGLPAGYVTIYGHLPFSLSRESSYQIDEDMTDSCDEVSSYLDE